MNNKTAIFVHPFWMTYKGLERLESYKQIITHGKYNKILLCLPAMSRETRKDTFRLCYEDLLIHFLELEKTLLPEDEIPFFKVMMSDMLNKSKDLSYKLTRLFYKYIVHKGYTNINKSNSLHDKKLTIFRILLKNKDEVVENLSDGLLSDFFVGDSSYREDSNFLIEELLKTKSTTELIPLWYGNVETIAVLAEEYGDFFDIEEAQVDVDVFGEYANQCVITVIKHLRRHYGIKLNFKKEYSLFYSRSYEKGKFVKTNKNNKYLAVFNAPVTDKDDEVITEESYYSIGLDLVKDSHLSLDSEELKEN